MAVDSPHADSTHLAPAPRPLRILVVANLYPSADHPAFGTFVASRVAALRRAGADVEVVAIRESSVHQAIIGKYLRLGLATLRVGLGAAARGRRYDVVEAHIAYPTGIIAWPVAAVHGARLVLFVHGSDVIVVARRSRLHRLLARALFRFASQIVVNSAFMEAATTAHLRVPLNRLVVQSPGIDFGLFAGASLPRPEDRAGILFVGRLSGQKGVRVLCAAVARMASSGQAVPLTLIGAGPERPAIEAAATDRSVPIHLIDPLPPAGVASAMRHAAVVAVPSAHDEALGLVALEAMAAGAIVVATRTGGLTETVIDGETGLLCDPGDAADLEQALVHACAVARDADAWEQFVRRGHVIAMRHGSDLVAADSLERYRELLAGRR